MNESLAYQSGFGNEFASEAVAGALPQGRNSPQQAPHGLYAELLSGTAFTAPRALNRRTWMYRRQPSVVSGAYAAYEQPLWTSGAAGGVDVPPDPLRWHPFPIAAAPLDFVDGVRTVVANGDVQAQTGMAALVYTANRSMTQRVLVNADGEMLFVPQQGRLRIATELGRLEVAPGEIAVVPRGMACRVELPDGPSRGYVCENYGAFFRLPELGPIGSNGLANARDFQTPVAAFDDDTGPIEVIRKFGGRLWRNSQTATPFNVVAWHGNLVPFKYDTARFMAIGTVSYDHPDPSIFTVLTSPSDTAGTANCDFVIFPPRWMVAEDTFRPPWYHRNVMSEFMGLVYGQYDAKPQGFVPGGFSLHNMMLPHGPDMEAFEVNSTVELKPKKLEATMAFMFETRFPQRVTRYAAEVDARQEAYRGYGRQLKKHFDPSKP
ncbi:MAG TPA: homogentisate 1,2-dioxygenase [Burkholderiaceae bacterium]|nr:homogentisate 1,2-dioxygenase [Burkholderiaceae bacterium]